MENLLGWPSVSAAPWFLESAYIALIYDTAYVVDAPNGHIEGGDLSVVLSQGRCVRSWRFPPPVPSHKSQQWPGPRVGVTCCVAQIVDAQGWPGVRGGVRDGIKTGSEWLWGSGPRVGVTPALAGFQRGKKARRARVGVTAPLTPWNSPRKPAAQVWGKRDKAPVATEVVIVVGPARGRGRLNQLFDPAAPEDAEPAPCGAYLRQNRQYRHSDGRGQSKPARHAPNATAAHCAGLHPEGIR